MCSCDVSVHPPFYEDDNNQGPRSKGFVPKYHASVVRDENDDTPTPVPTPTPDSPSMKIEMCLMPGNYGRRPIAHPSINVVLVDCKPSEICVESGSSILGNELGYV